MTEAWSRLESAETMTPTQIAWVQKDATARRIAAACELLLRFGDLEQVAAESPDAGHAAAYAEARQICAEAWNASRELAKKRLRVDIEVFLPRPSPRIISSPEERQSAMDWQVQVTVRDWGRNDDEGAIAMRGEGDVSLYQPMARRRPNLWSRCRHCAGHEEDETAWIHGASLRRVLDWLTRLSPSGIEVARQLTLVLAGNDEEWADEMRHTIDLNPSGVIPGDIVEHHGSLRVGVAQPGARVCRDGTVEHPIHVLGELEAPQFRLAWNSMRIRRLPWGDPYRNYLEWSWTADSGGFDISTQDWTRLAIELSGQGMPREANGSRRRLVPGDGSALKQARAHWWDAARDCSRRAGGPDAPSVFEAAPES